MSLSVVRPRALDADEANESELRWVARAQAGEPEALDWLVRVHAQLVERMLVRILGRRQDLDDLTQNVFVETLRALPTFRSESSIRTFVAAIAVRVARRALRPSLVVRMRAELAEDALSTQGSAPDVQWEAHKRLQHVRDALAHLSDKKRIAFLLWSLEGLAPEEIAKIMSSTTAATRSRIYHAQKELLERATRDPVLREWLSEGPL